MCHMPSLSQVRRCCTAGAIASDCGDLNGVSGGFLSNLVVSAYLRRREVIVRCLFNTLCGEATSINLAVLSRHLCSWLRVLAVLLRLFEVLISDSRRVTAVRETAACDKAGAVAGSPPRASKSR